MAIDVAAVQERLRKAGLDGWLLYDFHGSNPIAARLAGLTGGTHMTTRRWYYLIPANGQPRGLVHAVIKCLVANPAVRLNGHEKGAFTGAVKSTKGLFTQAHESRRIQYTALDR